MGTVLNLFAEHTCLISLKEFRSVCERKLYKNLFISSSEFFCPNIHLSSTSSLQQPLLNDCRYKNSSQTYINIFRLLWSY